jgi:DamX protein
VRQDAPDDRAWILTVPGELYTVQVAAGTELPDLEATAAQLPPGLPASVVKTRRAGLDWYVLVAGAYPSVADARRAIGAMPGELQQLEPWVRGIEDLRQAVQGPVVGTAR